MRWLLIFLIWFLSPQLLWAQTIRLGFSDVETFPYQMGNGMRIAEPPGAAVELIKQAADEIGVEVVFSRMPNKRVMLALRTGQIDGAFIFSWNEERAAVARYPQLRGKLDPNRRVARLAYYLYRMPNSAVDWDGRKFLNLYGNIGANTGYSIVDDLTKQGVQVEEARNTEQNFEKLRLGRLAAVAAQDEMADPYLIKAGLSQIEKLPKPLVAKDYYLLFSHQYADRNSALVEKLWDKIAQLRESRWKDLVVRYPLP